MHPNLEQLKDGLRHWLQQARTVRQSLVDPQTGRGGEDARLLSIAITQAELALGALLVGEPPPPSPQFAQEYPRTIQEAMDHGDRNG